MTYDPSLSHFDLDFARGAQGQLFVDNITKMLGDGSGRIEVKTDAWYVKSRRLFVELECQGRDGVWRLSGLNTTKALIWAYVLGKHELAIFIETEWLRKAVGKASQDKRNTESAKCSYGENHSRGCYVYLDHILNTRDMSRDEH